MEGMKTTMKDNAVGVFGFAQRQVDRVVSPNMRQTAYENTSNFAAAKPLLFGFLLSQLLFAFLPLLIFVCFVLSTAAFAAGVAIIFSLFWIFMAMVLLVPTLFVAFGVGVLVWVWAVSSFIIGRWMYGLIPGGFKGVARVNGPAGTKVVLLKDEAGFHAHKEEHD